MAPAAEPTAAAEGRARELLRSVAGDEVAEMYERLGFVAVEDESAEHGYLLYPQRPVVSYDARSGELLSEHCVRFREDEEGRGARPLPDADDVLAKWMALKWDEAHVLGIANLDLVGTQLDPEMLRRDLATLRTWREAG